jgi:hypothetical protein
LAPGAAGGAARVVAGGAMGDGGSRCVRLGRRSACGSHVLLLARGDAFYGTVVVSGLVAGSGRALVPLSLELKSQCTDLHCVDEVWSPLA